MIKINSAITNIVERMLELYRNQLIDKNINASNTLSNTASTIVEIDDTRLMVSFNLEDYWKYVEYGRGPGKRPPIDAIEQWIKVKPIIPDPINGRVPTTKQLAFLVSRKIGMEGTKAQRPLEKAVYSDSMELLINQLKDELVGQLKEELGNFIEKEEW